MPQPTDEITNFVALQGEKWNARDKQREVLVESAVERGSRSVAEGLLGCRRSPGVLRLFVMGHTE